jgi:hypothetical protein
MKRALVLFLLTAALLGVSAASVTAASAGTPVAGPVRMALLQPVSGSGVHGIVVLLPTNEGSKVFVVVRGLQPNTEYGSFYYDDNACMVDPEAVGTFTSNSRGVGFIFADIDEDVDEVGSVSVRTPDYSTLFACADTTR